MFGEKSNPQKLTKIIFEINFSRIAVSLLIFDSVRKFLEILFEWIAFKNFATCTLLATCHCHALLPLKIVYIEKRGKKHCYVVEKC